MDAKRSTLITRVNVAREFIHAVDLSRIRSVETTLE